MKIKKVTPLIITINRQLGSGGAYIGQQLSQKLNIFYADREIIRKSAQQLSMLVKELEYRDEKIQSFWQSFLEKSAVASGVYMPPAIMAPSDHKLFEIETDVIKHIVKERSAVIIGRCGFHIFNEYPNRIKIFLHGKTAFRNERVQKLYNVSTESAGEMITKSDKERTLYCKTFTGKEWTDARNYNISIDTSRIGIDKTVELILYYINK